MALLQLELTDRDGIACGEVHVVPVLDKPARFREERVDLLAGLGLGRVLAASGRHRSASLGLLSLRSPRLGSGLAGLLGACGPLFGRHRLKGPLAADASAFSSLLFEELENFGWQFLHNGANLNPVWVVGNGDRCNLKGV